MSCDENSDLGAALIVVTGDSEWTSLNTIDPASILRCFTNCKDDLVLTIRLTTKVL